MKVSRLVDGRHARRFAVLALALLALPTIAWAQQAGQTGSIAGIVTDEQGGPLAGVTITIDVPRLEARTRANGAYVLGNVPAGTQVVRARLIGYRPQTATVTVSAGQRATQNFTLVADPLNLAEVVVTGTQTPRVKLDASVAVTVLSSEEIEQASPRSTTEMLRYVPGFTRVESSGGEVNQNITMRGILGVEYVMFMEDGLPVFPTMHTFFMNADNLFRPDENIDRIEVVRGGSSALFGSNTPGAIINFINRSGGPEIGGTMKASGGTQGLARYDLNLNGPVGDDWRFNLGGFYRYDHGVRDPGFPGIRGGQFKASLTRQLDRGYLRGSLKVIDDRNQFILPLPFVDPDSPEFVSGFSNYGAMNTREGNHIRVPIPTGELELPLDDGLRTEAYWLTADAFFDLGDGWSLRNTGQVMNNDQGWNAILPFDVLEADAFAASEIGRLAGAGLVSDSATATSALVFTNHFDEFGDRQAFNTANGLVSTGGEWHVEKPLTAFQNQLQITRATDFGNVSLGVYFANYTQGNRWFFTDILMDVRDNPRFVDLLVFDGTDTIEVTKNGFRNFLSNYVNGNGQATVFSGVLGGDVRLSDRLRADLGFRYEFNDFVQSSENTSTVDLDGDPATPFDQEPWGDGTFRHFGRNLDDWAASVGLNYTVNDEISVYALGARAYKMPALDEFLVAEAQDQVELFEPRRTNSIEGGVKYAGRRISATVSGFWTLLKNIVGQGAVLDTLTGRITWEVRTSPENRSYGAEVEVSAVPTQGLQLLGNATFLKAELGSGAGADIGSWINGVPPVIGNLAARYTTGTLSLLGDWHLVGRRFADFQAGVELPAYNYFNIGGSYAFPDLGITVSADLLNVFQSKGLEEGNPRLVGARPVFLARPLLPRRFVASVRYTF